MIIMLKGVSRFITLTDPLILKMRIYLVFRLSSDFLPALEVEAFL